MQNLILVFIEFILQNTQLKLKLINLFIVQTKLYHILWIHLSWIHLKLSHL